MVMFRFLTGCALLLAAPAIRAEEVTGIAHAIDRDSLELGDREIRLFGIDAPEYRQRCPVGIANWSCGKDAASALRSLVEGRRVSCQARARDVYGRTVATCTQGGLDVALEMVGRGLDVVLEGLPTAYLDRQATSKAAHAGIWQSQFEMPRDYRAAHPRGDDAVAAGPASAARSAPSARSQPKTGPQGAMWQTCAQARAAGAAPVHRDEPGYNPRLDGDGDGDGIACEPYCQRR